MKKNFPEIVCLYFARFFSLCSPKRVVNENGADSKPFLERMMTLKYCTRVSLVHPRVHFVRNKDDHNTTCYIICRHIVPNVAHVEPSKKIFALKHAQFVRYRGGGRVKNLLKGYML